jgi:glucosamine kinase
VTRVLGVDGGQSAIRLQHSEAERSVEVEGVSRLEGDLVMSTADAVIDGWRLAGCPETDRVVLGLTTAPPDGERAEAICRLVGEATGVDDVWLADDSVTAHYGALSGTTGVALVVGTGVACLALPAHADPKLFDGNGYLVGCVGSAFWIGSSAVRAVLRRNDGIGAATELERVAERRYGPISGLREVIYAESRPVNAIAQFARDVLEVAAEGDIVADAIIGSAAIELAATAQAGAAWVGEDVVDVALGGKLLASGTLLRRRLEETMEKSVPKTCVRTADASGLAGALCLGLDNAAERYRGLVHQWRKPTV